MPENNIVGRHEEIKELKEILKSKDAEFLAVYGRRRVGKTFLIREFFSNKGAFFELTGVKDLHLSEQLENFATAFSKTFFENLKVASPTSWSNAFSLLTNQIIKIPKNKKIVIFLDELPWLASRKSNFIPALDYIWNREWSRLPNIILIVCGSAASWMLEHIVQAKGGLFHRVTKRMALRSFTLKETEEYFRLNRGIHLRKKQITDLYMVMGGIPFYLKEVKKGMSTAQLIDKLCFQVNGLLYSEFSIIFKSLFDQSEINLQIVREIAKSGNAISREDLITATNIASGGTLNKRLEELAASEFIQHFVPLGKRTRDRFYRIIDEYTLFYLKWIEPLINTGNFQVHKGYWLKMQKTPAYLTWAGLAFESLCFKHIYEISKALKLENIPFRAGSWRYIPSKNSKEKGAQIDLVFDREDNTISLCEIKYSEEKFEIEKNYALNLLQKIHVFENNYPNKRKPTRKQIHLAMTTTFGTKDNKHALNLVDNEVKLEDLFS